MHVRRIVLMLFLVSLGIAWNRSCAEEQAGNLNPEEAAIRKAAAQYLDALKRGDAPTLIAAWTADGDYIDSSGNVFKASDLIRKQYPAGSIARENGSREVAPGVSTIRLITSDVAIEDGVAEFRSAGDELAGPGRYTVVWKKRGGKWLIDSVREAAGSPASVSAAQEPANSRLTELAWLAGDWTGSSGKLTYDISANFMDEDQKVLELKFAVLDGNRRVLVGTEYVTRDPGTSEITSCAIDSGGGHAEGLWTVDDKTWAVDIMGALADGTALESTNVYTPHSDGSVTWSVIDAQVDGEAVPDVFVKLSRKPTK